MPKPIQSFISFAFLAGMLFSASSFVHAQEKASDKAPSGTTSLKVSDLPVVDLATTVRKQLYPMWSEDALPLTSSITHSDLSQLTPPHWVSTIREQMARAVSLHGEQDVQHALENHPDRWLATIKTVNLFANEEAVSFEPREQNRALEKEIGLIYLKSIDPWRLVFSLEDVRRFLGDRKGLRAAINGENLRWVDDIATQSKQRHRSWLVDNRQALSTLSATAGLPSFCPKNRLWSLSPERFIRQGRLDLHRRTGFCDDISGRMSRVEPDNEKALAQLFDSMIKEYDELIEGVDRQPLQTPYVTFLAARMAVLDPHSAYIPASNRSSMSARMNGAYVGVGVTMMYKASSVTFEQVSADGPAFEAGIRKGDTLVGIGPSLETLRPADQFSSVQITSMLSGLEGGSVVLRVRDAAGVVSEKTVRRRRISINDGRIRVSTLKDDISVLHIRISGFYEDTQDHDRPGGSTAADLRRALEKASEHDWVLIDLRGNGGGLLSQAVKVSGLFLPPGPVVQVESPSGETATMLSEEAPVWTGPLAILVDRSSASASEIMAAALQDRGRAVILGERSFGKGTAQQQYDLDRWAGAPASVYGYLSLTSLRFFRPSGQTTQVLGVIPDISFFPEQGIGRERDKDFVLVPTQLDTLLPAPSQSPWASCYPYVQQLASKAWDNSEWAPEWIKAREISKGNPIALSERRALIQEQKQSRERLVKAISHLPEKDAGLSVALTSLSSLQRCILSASLSETSNQESL